MPSPSHKDRLLHKGIAANLRRRAAIVADIRRFFDDRGYLEVDTPIMVPSPGLDLHLDAYEVSGGGFLITSPEYQMKRLVVGGLSRIFQLVRCFRRGERGARHNPEFTMLEWYQTGCSMEALMDETEQLVRHVLQTHADPARVPLLCRPCDWTKPFERMTVAEAYRRFASADMHRLSEDDYFRVLVEQVEPGIAQLGVPLLLHDYPAREASLARRRDDAPEVCERFELYLGDLELCNGFGELTDPLEQRERLLADQAKRRKAGKPVYPIDERFLEALEEGMPAAAGNALGVDRLVALCCGAPSIDQVMAFPVDWL